MVRLLCSCRSGISEKAQLKPSCVHYEVPSSETNVMVALMALLHQGFGSFLLLFLFEHTMTTQCLRSRETRTISPNNVLALCQRSSFLDLGVMGGGWQRRKCICLKIGRVHCIQYPTVPRRAGAKTELNSWQTSPFTCPSEDSPYNGVTILYGKKHVISANVESSEDAALESS